MFKVLKKENLLKCIGLDKTLKKDSLIGIILLFNEIFWQNFNDLKLSKNY